MAPRSPLAFVLFWLAGLAAGTTLVMLVVGGGIGWLWLAAAPAVVLLALATGRRRRP